MLFAQKNPNRSALKEQNNKLWLTIEYVKTVDEAIAVLAKISAMIVVPKDELV